MYEDYPNYGYQPQQPQQPQQKRQNEMPPVSGKLVWKGDIREGRNERTGNEWKLQDFAIEWLNEDSQYESHAVFTMSGVDKVNSFRNIPLGTPVEVSFSLDGRESNGRWYGQLKAWRVRSLVQNYQPQAQQRPRQQAPATGNQRQAAPQQMPLFESAQGLAPKDDMPF